MESSLDDKKKTLKLENGKTIRYLAYFTFNIFISYQEIVDFYETPKEKFRYLISKAEIIESFTAADYSQLTDTDLARIALSFDIESNKDGTLNADVFEEILRELKKKDDEIRESLLSVFNSLDLSATAIKMSKIIKPIQEMSRKLAEHIAPVTKQIQAVGSKWAEVIGKFVIEHEMYLDAKQKAMLVATKYDWFVAYDLYTDTSFYNDLVTIDGEENSGELIDNLFLDHYSEDIRHRMVEDLRGMELLEQYDEILNQVEFGYNKGLYYLVVPSLFAIIEGMIARGFNHKGQMSGTHLTGYIDELLKEDNVNSLHEIINKRMLARFEHGTKIDSPISRHAIIHGGDINYGKEAIALRLFLIFYNIAVSLGFWRTNLDIQNID